MELGEKIEHFIKTLMYEKGRSKKYHGTSNKIDWLNQLSQSLDEMEEYIDEKIKDYQISKRK